MRLLKNSVLGLALFVAFFTAVCGSSTALAAELFVDAVNGSDFTGNGSALAPYQTLTKGMGSAVSGDVVHLAPGLYNTAIGEVFPVVMKPGVSVLGESTSTTVVSPDDAPALLFVYGNFDPGTRVEGLTMRAVGNAQYEPGVVVAAFSFGGYVTDMSPTINNNVIENFEIGIGVVTDGGPGYFPVNASPTLSNNIVRGSDEVGIGLYAANSTTIDSALSSNLIEGDNEDTTGVFAYALGGTPTVPYGGHVGIQARNNVVSHGYYGFALYADDGAIAPFQKDAPQRLGGMAVSASPGHIDATLTNNIIEPGFNEDGVAVYLAPYAGSDEYGGRIDLTMTRNRSHNYYGVYMDGEQGDPGYPGAQVNITLSRNELLQTYSDPDEWGLGVFVWADAESNINVDLDSNVIEHNYGVVLEAGGDDSGDTDGKGASIVTTITNNVIDTTAVGYDEGYGVFLESDGGWTGGGAESGGNIQATVTDNRIDGYYGVFADAGGSFAAGAPGGNISLDVQRNNIVGVNVYNEGSGVYALADNMNSGGGPGGTLGLNLVNNTVRGYTGVQLRQLAGANALESGDLDATIVNNTIIGSGVGPSYDEGYALEIRDGASIKPLNPTVVNNILAATSFSTEPVVRVQNAFNEPALFNNNLIQPGIGGELSNFGGVTQSDIADVNAYGFASGNLAGTPRFVCPGDENYNLLATSPAIDLADAGYAPATDLLGHDRTAGMGPDIGAYEFQGQVGPRFWDVDTSYLFYNEISAIAMAGITNGCQADPPLYCPEAAVSREQMAVFLIRALGEQPDSSSPALFSDVSSWMWSFGHIQRLAQIGVTNGCGGGRFCPSSLVTRYEMAVFLIRALGESPVPCTGTFSDVPPTAWYCGHVERLAQIGVTRGCGAGQYCPNQSVTRGQMAAFLQRAFNLQLPTTCGGINPPRVAQRGDDFPEGMLVAEPALSGAGHHETMESAPAGGRHRASLHVAEAGVGVVPQARKAGVGPVGIVGPIPNDRLTVPASELEASRALPGRASAPEQRAVRTGEARVRLTPAQRQAWKESAGRRMHEARQQNLDLSRVQVLRQEQAAARGAAIPADVLAKWEWKNQAKAERKALCDSEPGWRIRRWRDWVRNWFGSDGSDTRTVGRHPAAAPAGEVVIPAGGAQ